MENPKIGLLHNGMPEFFSKLVAVVNACADCGCQLADTDRRLCAMCVAGPRFDRYGNRVNEDGSLWNLDGKLAARNGNE